MSQIQKYLHMGFTDETPFCCCSKHVGALGPHATELAVLGGENTAVQCVCISEPLVPNPMCLNGQSGMVTEGECRCNVPIRNVCTEHLVPPQFSPAEHWAGEAGMLNILSGKWLGTGLLSPRQSQTFKSSGKSNRSMVTQAWNTLVLAELCFPKRVH